jgi:hypothetical protein
MKIVLVSPKGPLYRHKGGIFSKRLRYQPLTLTTLAALIPAELGAEVELIDEGIQDVNPNLEADGRAVSPWCWAAPTSPCCQKKRSNMRMLSALATRRRAGRNSCGISKLEPFSARTSRLPIFPCRGYRRNAKCFPGASCWTTVSS